MNGDGEGEVEGGESAREEGSGEGSEEEEKVVVVARGGEVGGEVKVKGEEEEKPRGRYNLRRRSGKTPGRYSA